MTEGDTAHREEMARTTRESVIYLASKFVPFLCNLLFIKFYTGYFTQEVIGQYETILALAMMLSSLAVGWLQISLLRLYPKYRLEERTGDLMYSIAIGFIASVAITFLVGGILWAFSGTDWGTGLSLDLLPWVGILFLSNCLFILTTTLLRAKRFPLRFSIASASYSLFNLSFVYLIALFLGSLLLSLVAGTMIGLLLPSFAILFFSTRRTDSTRAQNKGLKPLVAPLLAFGLPLSINQAASQILNVSDRYIILVLLGETEAGLYSVIYRIADFAARFVILSLMMSAYTSVTETFEQRGREAAEKLVSSLTRVFLLLAVPLVGGLWFLQSEVVEILSGPEYGEGAHLVGWILLGNFFLGLSQYANFGLHLSGRTLTLAMLTLTAAVLNIGLNWILLPRYGYPAAAYTTCLSFGLLALVTPFFANKSLTWRVRWISLIRILIASAIMLVVLVVLRGLFDSAIPTTVIACSGGGIVYGLMLFVLGEISLRDLRIPR